MSDDLDFDMEVVDNDELDELDADSTSSGKSSRTGKDETNGADALSTRSDSQVREDEASQSSRSAGSVDKNREVFGIGSAPEDWAISPLPSVVDIEMGSSPPSATYNEEEEGLPFYQGNADFGHMKPEVSTWCSDPVKTADRDDVLISIRAPVGDLNIADEHCCIGRGLAALRPDGVNGLYLYYGLAQRSRWLSRLASGSTFKSVSSADLEKVDLPVPPFPEQRKIASVLYTVDRAIQKTEAIIEQAKRVKRGLMQDLLVGGVDDREQIRNPEQEPERFRETALGKVPKAWEMVPLREACHEIVDSPHSTPDYSEEGILIVRTSDIEEGRLIFDEAKYVTEEDYQERVSRLKPRPGDIVFTREAPVGEAFKIPDGTRLCLGQRTMALRTENSILNPDFLVHSIYSYRIQKRFDQLVVGTTNPHLNVGTIRNFKVPVPSLEEQKQIVSVLSSIDEQIEEGMKCRSELERLKKGLMQDLLTGEVRTADKAIEILDEVEAHG